MKRALPVAAVVCLLILLILRPARRGSARPETVASPEMVAPPTSPVSRSTPRSVLTRPGPLPETRAAAEPILQRAVKTFELAEIEKRRLPKDFIAKSTLEGFQRKMFLDDYNYAALIYGKTGSSAGEAYSNLVSRVASMTDEDLQREADSPADPVPDGPAVAKMQQFYSLALSSPNPGYSNVLETLRTVVPNDDPTASDLLKDALTYVAAKTDVAKVVAADEEANEKTKSWIANTQKPEAREKALAQFELTHERPTEAVQPTAEALDRLFADRFARHGLDGNTIVASLNSLSLTNVAQEIWIPTQ